MANALLAHNATTLNKPIATVRCFIMADPASDGLNCAGQINFSTVGKHFGLGKKSAVQGLGKVLDSSLGWNGIVQSSCRQC